MCASSLIRHTYVVRDSDIPQCTCIFVTLDLAIHFARSFFLRHRLLLNHTLLHAWPASASPGCQPAAASCSQVEYAARWMEGWVRRTYSNIVRTHTCTNADRNFGPSDPFRSIFFSTVPPPSQSHAPACVTSVSSPPRVPNSCGELQPSGVCGAMDGRMGVTHLFDYRI
jgi:hypothetical protein